MKTKTQRILTFLKVLAWIALIGYSIQCGSQLISFVIAFVNPDLAKYIPGTSMDLHSLYQHSLNYFIYVMSFAIALSAMHAYVWYWIVKLLSSLNLQNPFSNNVAKILERIGVQLFVIWFISVVAEQSTEWMARKIDLDIGKLNALNEYLFFAGIVYIISQVFKRGIEIQQENELTV